LTLSLQSGESAPCDSQIDWAALEHPLHREVQRLIVDLNRLYAHEPALYVLDNDSAGFRWLVLPLARSR
jgi:1,4-alpha-glucan branching enzyme